MLHKHTTPSTKAPSADTHNKGTHSRRTQCEHRKRKRAKRKHAEHARTAGTRNAGMGCASAQNASMHNASTKHGPAHPRDVDDVDGRRPHDVDERYTSAPHDQHEGARPEHAQLGPVLDQYGVQCVTVFSEHCSDFRVFPYPPTNHHQIVISRETLLNLEIDAFRLWDVIKDFFSPFYCRT